MRQKKRASSPVVSEEKIAKAVEIFHCVICRIPDLEAHLIPYESRTIAEQCNEIALSLSRGPGPLFFFGRERDEEALEIVHVLQEEWQRLRRMHRDGQSDLVIKAYLNQNENLSRYRYSHIPERKVVELLVTSGYTLVGHDEWYMHDFSVEDGTIYEFPGMLLDAHGNIITAL
jgi:hypothetical protein